MPPPPNAKIEARASPVLGLRTHVLPVQDPVGRQFDELGAPGGGKRVTVDLIPKKTGFRGLFAPDHPARLALEAQPDSVSDEEYATLYPVLVRLAGVRSE